MDNTNKNSLKSKDVSYLGIILDYFLQYWKLFVISLFLCVASAAVYLQLANKAYRVNAKVLLRDEEKGTFNSQVDMLADFGFQTTNSNVENEVEVLSSKVVVQMAVKRSGLFVKYTRHGILFDRPISKYESRVQATMIDKDLDALDSRVEVKLLTYKDSLYKATCRYYNADLNEIVETEPVVIDSYPYVISTIKGDVLLTENEKCKSFDDVTIEIHNPSDMAVYYQSVLDVLPISKTASVSVVTLVDYVPRNGIDFINSLIVCYNIQANEDKNIVAQKTEEFIGARIKIIGEDLRAQEKNLASYKKENKLINPTADVTRLLESESEYVERLQDIEIQLQQANYLLAYLKDSKNDKQAIPTVPGLANEPALTALITRYNMEVAKRKQLLISATEENPMVVTISSNIAETQNDIIEVLETLCSSIKMRKEKLEGLSGEFTARASQTPAVERVYADLTRERDIKSQLYVMLLQKYEENALALAVTADNLKCIENASCSGAYVFPNKKTIYVLALFVGLLIPILFVYIVETLGVKIKGVEDVDKLTALPIMGCVPLSPTLQKNSKRQLLVKEGKNDVMAEAFRTIRTNLQFVVQKSEGRVIMFTSTTSGEGKTFISSNYAASLAIMGKKVLYVGLDIRRPRLSEVFGFSDGIEGITSFLASDGSDLKMLEGFIRPSGVNPNLDLLTAGVIPPNPAELLATSNLDKAIAHLSKKYEYVVLDTAPVGLVSDSVILSRVADAVVYVARANYTNKSDLEFLNKLVEDGKFKNASIVLNADDMNAKRGRYGMRYKRYYGYSYYGYGYGYTSEEERK